MILFVRIRLYGLSRKCNTFLCFSLPSPVVSTCFLLFSFSYLAILSCKDFSFSFPFTFISLISTLFPFTFFFPSLLHPPRFFSFLSFLLSSLYSLRRHSKLSLSFHALIHLSSTLLSFPSHSTRCPALPFSPLLHLNPFILPLYFLLASVFFPSTPSLSSTGSQVTVL